MSDHLDQRRRECLDILELQSGASPLEIRNAYVNLKDLYTEGSLALTPVEDEFTPEMREELLQKIEDAYMWLLSNQDMDSGAKVCAYTAVGVMTEDMMAEIDAMGPLGGPELRKVREMVGINLSEIELVTKISRSNIIAIEEEDYASLPEEVFIKGYLQAYARCLGLDRDRVVADYMTKYHANKKK